MFNLFYRIVNTSINVTYLIKVFVAYSAQNTSNK